MSYLRVAVVQGASPSISNDPKVRKEENLSRMMMYIDQMVMMNPRTQLVLFPELYINGIDPINWGKMAEPIPNGPVTALLAQKAKELNIYIAPGSYFELGDDGNVYNTAVLIDPKGDVVLKYRKIFIPYPLEPSHPGNEFPVYEIPSIGKVGIVICADGHYPESVRNLALKGAEIILKPTLQGEWIGGLRNHTPVVITRAIENQCYIVDASQPSPIGMGDSVIVDPEGRIIEQLGVAESFTFATLNVNDVRRVREEGSCGMFGFLHMLKEFKVRGCNVDEMYMKGIEHAPIYDTLTSPHPKEPKDLIRFDI